MSNPPPTDAIERVRRQVEEYAMLSDHIRGIAVADLREILAFCSEDKGWRTIDSALQAGTISVTSFDGHCVRIDFETREEADKFAAALPPPTVLER